jgi:Fungal N-terminal domain of STAND proteins
MAELAIGIVGLIAPTLREIKVLHKFFNDFENAPEKVQAINRELADLISILDTISQTIEFHRDNAMIGSAIQSCFDAVGDLQEMIKLGGEVGKSEKWRKMMKIARNREKIQNCIERLERSRGRLSLAVSL